MASESLIAKCKELGIYLVTAESLTAGLLGHEITAESGSSEVFIGGIVSYQQSTKQELLGVSSALMGQQGTVDPEVAIQMATGVRGRFAKVHQVDFERVVGISTTGVAGPGASEGKPPGTVFIGISSAAGDVVYAFQFKGDRASVRTQVVASAIEGLREQLQLLEGC